MPNKYPEHIDEIDEFYRSQLADLEIAPPDGLWDKIGVGPMESQDTQKDPPTGGGWTLGQKVLAWSLASLIVLGSLWYWGPNVTNEPSPVPQDSLPVKENSLSPSDSLAAAPRTQDASTEDGPASEQRRGIQSLPKNKAAHQDADIVPVEASEQAPNGQTEQLKETLEKQSEQNEARDSIAGVQQLEPKKKEKVKFKDKYKKEYQDSTRKIFVPGK